MKDMDKNKDKVPVVNDISINQDTGNITIDSVSIDTFQVKYYPIDAEILFSSSPFVEEQIETFSYVMPFSEMNVQTKKDSNIVEVLLPQNLKGKNMIIEVKSNYSWKFLNLFSCDLTVQVKELLGEIRVLLKKDMKQLDSIYVKVFVKTKDGKEKFFKDGFTDFLGNFQYAHASGMSDSKDLFEKFAIFVSHPVHGSIVKYADASKLDPLGSK